VLRVVRLVWLALGDHEHVAMASWQMPPGRQIHRLGTGPFPWPRPQPREPAARPPQPHPARTPTSRAHHL